MSTSSAETEPVKVQWLRQTRPTPREIKKKAQTPNEKGKIVRDAGISMKTVIAYGQARRTLMATTRDRRPLSEPPDEDFETWIHDADEEG
jgi:hypothetical protein